VLKAIVIDDEKGASESLCNIIQAKCPEVKIVAEAHTVNSALIAIQNNKPDLIFLDIQLGNETGFELLEKIGQHDFEVIFTTAYDKYAIRAIKFAALDYLLKPIDTDELVAAIRKAELKRSESSRNDNIPILLNNRKKESISQTIGLPTLKGFNFVEISDIIRLEASGSYTMCIFKNKEKVLVTHLLKEFEELLDDSNFFRVHHSHLINVKYIKQYIRGDGGEIVMADDSVIPVSKRKKLELLGMMRLLR